MSFDAAHCTLCPRQCSADRTNGVGACHCGTEIRIARAALHYWEEPCISGKDGSGAVFFAGCALGCVFCQNQEISRCAVGKVLTVGQLADAFLRLQEQNANNINLVTGSHFTPWIVQALELTKPKMHIPVVWNCGGYESLEILHMLDGLVDIYLPDLKFYTAETAKAYANCPDYFSVASKAILEMYRQVEALSWNGDLLERGLMVRHLVLPGHVKNSKAVIKYLLETYKDQILISIMNQYTPMPQVAEDPLLGRKVTKREYEKVIDYALELGMEDGFIQEGEAAKESFIPEFNLEGI